MKPEQQVKPKKTRKQWKPTAFERRVEARVTKQVATQMEDRLEENDALTEGAAPAAAGTNASSGPKASETPAGVSPGSESALAQARRILKEARLENDPAALRLLRQARGESDQLRPQAELRLLSDLADLLLRRLEKPAARASHAVQPSGGGLPPMPDLRAEYEKRAGALRPGDLASLMELKREFRKKGLQVY